MAYPTLSNPGVQDSSGYPHAAGISGADQNWRCKAPGDARSRRESQGSRSAEAGRGQRRIWAQFPPQARWPRPRRSRSSPPPRLLPQAGPGLPPGSPSARPALARPPRRYILGEYGDGCAGLPGNPTWGGSATRSGLLTAQPQALTVLVLACPGSAAVPLLN